MPLQYRRKGYGCPRNLPDRYSEEDGIHELAEAAADDYWHNHDGFEAQWPIVFEILQGGEVIGAASVDMDTQPVFTANQCD